MGGDGTAGCDSMHRDGYVCEEIIRSNGDKCIEEAEELDTVNTQMAEVKLENTLGEFLGHQLTGYCI